MHFKSFKIVLERKVLKPLKPEILLMLIQSQKKIFVIRNPIQFLTQNLKIQASNSQKLVKLAPTHLLSLIELFNIKTPKT